MLRKFLAIWIICCMMLSLPANVLSEEIVAEMDTMLVVQSTEEVETTEISAESATAEPTASPAPEATATAEIEVSPAPEATATVEPEDIPAATQVPSDEEDENGPKISIRLEMEGLSVCAGDSFELVPEFSDGNAHEYAVLIDDETVLRYEEDGRFAALAVGKVVLTFSSEYGDAVCAVEVIDELAQLNISISKERMKAGESAEIQLEGVSVDCLNVIYASSDETVANVDSYGHVTAVAPGECTIIAEAYNGVSGSVELVVYAEPTELTLNESSITLRVDQTFMLKAKTDVGSTDGIVWNSSDENVAICEDGMIVCNAAGECEIIATLPNGLNAACAVEVKAMPAVVTLPYKTLTIGVGESIQLEPDAGDTITEFCYMSTKTKYATVSASGVVKGVKKGTSVVRIRTDNNIETSVTINVCKAPSKVTVSPTSMILGVGEMAKISYTLPKNTAGKVTFASADEKIAAVDPVTGEVTAVAPGKVKIRARTFNNKTAFVTVEVKNAPETLSLSPEKLTVGVGQIITMDAAINSGAAGKITLTSSDTGMLAVSGLRIKGIAAGTAELTANTYNGLEAHASVTVVPAPKKVTLPYKTLTIGVGESVQLTPDADEGITDFTYTSKSTKYVKVDAAGVVKGVKKGSSKVYVKTYNGKQTYVTVKVCTAPKTVKPSVSKLELSVGQTGKIGYLLPSGTAGSVTYSSSNPEIVSVNAGTGEVVAAAAGEAVITLTTFNGKKAACTVKVFDAPDSISVNVQSLGLGIGEMFQLKTDIPEGSLTDITYSSSDNEIIKVSSEGKIKAVGKGTAVVRVQTHVPEVYAQVQIEVGDAPESVHVAQDDMESLMGESFRIEPILPAGSKSCFTFESSNPDIASVDENGMVTTLDVGTTEIKVSTFNGKTAVIKLKVWHPSYPEKITVLNAPDVVNLNDGGFELEFSVEPETAVENVQWVSSNSNVATVDENGVVTLHSYGYAIISAVSAKNPEIRGEFTLTVQMENLALTIPKRTTTESGIEANLALIYNIRSSAIAQVDALEEGGVISAADASKRRSIIRNIFADYAFPWKTPSYQPYWKAANSEGGVKDFQPDRVYYGMPYTSGSDGNNRYNVKRAVNDNRYVDSGKGYYILNQKNLRNGKYVGNDCSALVDAAIWGTDSSHMFDNTKKIASSSSYKTIKDPAKMRPGDLLCLSSRHVVMFLYYANPEKTKIMIIENGGAEAGTNTVHCAVHDLSYYTDLGYQVRRLKSLG